MRENTSTAEKNDVVVTFGLESFDDAVEREFCRPADQLLLALAADDRIGELLVADPWRSSVSALKRRRVARLSTPLEIGGRTAVRVRPQRVRRRDPLDLATTEASYRRYGELLGRALARGRGEREPAPASAVLVTCHPCIAAFCDAPWISKIIYFGRDDWATGAEVAEWADIYVEAYRRIDERKATIFAVSEELAERLSARTTVVPNGVIADIWRPHLPAPARIAQLPGPRAIYTGSLNQRLDRELVETTARNVGSVIMLGYANDRPTVDWLRSIDNVHVFEPVGQRELAATVQACDVGLIPHVDHPCVRAMSPLKLYEYLAGGIPVLSVDLPPVRGVDETRVRISDSANWAETLAEAIRMGPADEDHRQRFIDDVSWQQRMQVMVDAATAPE
ncbi:hypothetical protein OG921_00695 [Aldersonia sp. NBC_00410]|uniref:hypothetical protein n=1 Tax=Aldersonia sp. NBC_00410 TaxID=2975954 RepID=UPI002259AA5B|nr:hypothetical protein [Aldersonia sp. NBC_00410]MCX5041707.1 hypothetical protein [Aldersonia sp. NBC_00410]